MNKYELGKEFLRDNDRDIIDFSTTDQNLGMCMPPVEQPLPDGVIPIKLPSPKMELSDISLNSAIVNRKSVRKYSDRHMSLEELSYLLWMTHGVRRRMDNLVLRNVPSAGNRHAIDSYISVHKVEGLPKGIYRYQPLEHALALIAEYEDIEERCTAAARNQVMAGKAAVTFIWTAIPYRMEWRYSYASYKVIALDAGHICQNLYLAVEAIGAGACAIAAYNQELADELLKLDGNDEFVIYMASVGFNS